MSEKEVEWQKLHVAETLDLCIVGDTQSRFLQGISLMENLGKTGAPPE